MTQYHIVEGHINYYNDVTCALEWYGTQFKVEYIFQGNQNKVAYIEMAHGGHLGFYEGGLLHPNPVSWLDRSLVSIIGALVCAHMETKAPE
ncbi:Monoacylglycerol lipase abhd2 [Homalodisca vitripennis]|nr:Monoacylglycerol lipase abhd2 [Homalodisca vitripennis]